MVLGLVGSVGLASWGSGLVERQGVLGLAQAEEVEETRIVNVLVVGDDSREGLTPSQVREFGTGQAEGNRTDSVMLLQLEVNGDGRAAALSFPRDLRVKRCDGSVGKINAAYTIGVEREGDGPSCLVNTVNDLTGIPIHHYVEVSFAGFVNIVDAIGGVGLYLDQPIADEKAHIDLPAGCVRLTGADALGFVRARYVDNDFGRIARQQRFVKETLREATSLGVLANPQKLVRLVEAAAGAVRTDEHLGIAQMKELAQGMRAASADKLQVHTVPSTDERVAGGWYVVQLPQQARQLYASFRSGEVLEGLPTETEVPTPPVEVLNASGTKGLAAAAAELLRARDIPVGEVGNADVAGMTQSQVRYAPHLEKAAAKIANLLGGAELVAGEATDGLVAELGTDVDAADLRKRAAATPRVKKESEPATGTPPPSAATYRGAKEADVDC